MNNANTYTTWRVGETEEKTWFKIEGFMNALRWSWLQPSGHNEIDKSGLATLK
jgi:hypothetical protein